MRVCAHLDIPFLECDLTEVYKKGVADYMIAEYRAGRTPNPDVMCNKEVKFGGFLQWSLEHGADKVFADINKFSIDYLNHINDISRTLFNNPNKNTNPSTAPATTNTSVDFIINNLFASDKSGLVGHLHCMTAVMTNQRKLY